MKNNQNQGLYRFITTLSCLIWLVSSNHSAFSQKTFPGKKWQQFQNIEEAGFSPEKVQLIKEKFQKSEGAALLVISNGKILLSWGDNTRKYMVHSIRKSFMNAMIGREINHGTLSLDQTLEQLSIDDIGKLTPQEKMATVENLLSARSGIYLPSAYSPRGMEARLPERGSHQPGTYWYYNNWDFNTLFTIYEQTAGKKFFEAFQKEIADPIGMEDFELEDTYYRIEVDKSIHPAYLFRMSARDMARFGLLYLNKGKWNKKQLVPEEWVEKSTSAVSTDLGDFGIRGGYGFLWWIAPEVNGKKMYYASGSGGHRIMVCPEDDLVIVHRVNTYENKNVSDQAVNELVKEIIAAKIKDESPSPQLLKYNPPVKSLKNTYSGSMDQYIGTYTHRFLGEMSIKKDPDGYFLQNGVGIFRLYARDDSSFYTEDIESLLVMKKAEEDSRKFKIEPRVGEDGDIREIVFYY